jgi:hypothetical protein
MYWGFILRWPFCTACAMCHMRSAAGYSLISRDRLPESFAHAMRHAHLQITTESYQKGTQALLTLHIADVPGRIQTCCSAVCFMCSKQGPLAGACVT